MLDFELLLFFFHYYSQFFSWPIVPVRSIVDTSRFSHSRSRHYLKFTSLGDRLAVSQISPRLERNTWKVNDLRKTRINIALSFVFLLERVETGCEHMPNFFFSPFFFLFQSTLEKRLLATVLTLETSSLVENPSSLFDFTSFPFNPPAQTFQRNHPRNPIDQPYQPLEHTVTRPFDLLFVEFHWILLIVLGLSLKYPCRELKLSLPTTLYPLIALSFSLLLFPPFFPLRPISSKWYLDVTKTFVSYARMVLRPARASRTVLGQPLKGTIAKR